AFKTLAICVAANHIGRGLLGDTGNPAPVLATVQILIRASRLLQHRLECLAHLGRIARHFDAAGLHHGQLLLRRALAAGDDRAGVPHALACWRGDARDESYHRLLHVVLHPQRGSLFVRAANLAHHDHGLGVRIVVEHAQHVDVLHAVHRIAAGTDAGGLAQAQLHQLPDRFIGQRARARNDADASLLVDVAGHDADLDFVRCDDTGTVRSDQNALLVLLAHAVLDFDHVTHRYAFGDADHQVQVGIDRLPDRRGCKRRRNVDHRGVGARFLLRLLDAGVDRNAFEILARLFRVYAGDEAVPAVGVIARHARVELAGLAGDALRDDTGVLVDQDGHFVYFLYLPETAATIFCAASAMLSAEMIGKPESLRICRPISSLVPFMRTTRGTDRFTSRAAATTPLAMVSHCMMPPKMLTRIPLTFEFFSMILNASVTFSAVAPPPTSRKFAGSAPCSLIG